MRLAVIGSRTFKDYNLLKNELKKYIGKVEEIVSGGAIGADELAEKFAKEYNIPIKIFKPNWNLYGKAAGYKRNAEIWSYADEGIAFHDGVSSGTKHSIELSKFYGKKLNVIKF